MSPNTTPFPLTLLLALTAAILLTSPCHGCGPKPHIIFVMADDLGWSDVSWNAADMRTPNLQALKEEGVTLNNHYMQPACTASRVALMTGYYPFRMGLQRNDMAQFHRWRNHSLSTEIRILPEYLRAQGYATHLVGKWQMGFCNWEYTPTRRGFDTFYGSYGGNSGHYNHTPCVGGYDFRDNLNVDWSADGQYSTHLYTQRAMDIIQQHTDSSDTRPLFLFLSYEAPHSPIEAPQKYVDLCSHVTDEKRRQRCGMMAALDEGVHNVTQALRNLGSCHNDNILFIFTSDNGAPGGGGGSNWPLRGKKRSAYEGGVRVASFMYSDTLLPSQPYDYQGLMHVTDWLPTLLSVANTDADRALPRDVDGFDQWDRIRRNEPSRRTHMVYALDREENYSAVRINNLKLVQDNTEGGCWGWFNPPEGVNTDLKRKQKNCPEFQLFDLETDPSEQVNLLLQSEPPQFEELKQFMTTSKEAARDLPHVVNFTASFPDNWGGAWSPGWCETGGAHVFASPLDG